MTRTERRLRPPEGVRKVPVPCCHCQQPTAMRVPSTLLEEMTILHLCSACARAELPSEAEPVS